MGSGAIGGVEVGALVPDLEGVKGSIIRAGWAKEAIGECGRKKIRSSRERRRCAGRRNFLLLRMRSIVKSIFLLVEVKNLVCCALT